MSESSQQEDKALREQLCVEIENRTKACAHSGSWECSLLRVDGYKFCQKHILEDPRAPFKQCAFVYPNGRRCVEPAPKDTTAKTSGANSASSSTVHQQQQSTAAQASFCFEHSRQNMRNRLRQNLGKHRPIETPETLLNSLAHYVKTDEYKTAASATTINSNQTPHEEADTDHKTPCIDPYLDVETFSADESQTSILDYASDTSSGEELRMLNTSTRNFELEDSDNESVDSQNDDLLKHAGIYTTEEAAAITKDKLTKLQKLYMDQFSRLQHILRERRRAYLHALRREKESLSAIYNQYLDTPKEREMWAKLRALNHYHRHFGEQAILQRALMEKRARATEGYVPKSSFHTKCIFTEGGVKCGEKTLPSAKYCRKHILEDKRQVLFKACGVERSNVVCQEPVANIFDEATCVLHMSVGKALRGYAQRKCESDSEDEKDAVRLVVKEEQGEEAMAVDESPVA